LDIQPPKPPPVLQDIQGNRYCPDGCPDHVPGFVRSALLVPVATVRWLIRYEWQSGRSARAQSHSSWICIHHNHSWPESGRAQTDSGILVEVVSDLQKSV